MPRVETWPGLEVRVAPDRADEAEELLAAAIPADAFLGMARLTWQLGLAPAPDEPVRIQVYLAPGADMTVCAEQARDALDRAFDSDEDFQRRRVLPRSIPGEDWATRWKRFFRPIRISPRIAVVPAWEDAALALRRLGIRHPQAIVVRIEPGQAFGSGTHPTTHLSLALLESALEASPEARVLDFGAGSGILSFAAAALGARAVVAIEQDPDALENYRTNAALNAATGRIEYRIGSAESLRDDEAFGLIVCNALFDRVKDCFETMLGLLEPQGTFLYSGFLIEHREEVERHIGALGFEPERSVDDGEWGAGSYRRKS